MRRLMAILSALALVVSLSVSSVAASPAAPRSSSFYGDFNLIAPDGTLFGHATAQLFQPTNQRLVPGTYDFRGAPGNTIRESHAQIGTVHFWYDQNHMPEGATVPGGTVAFASGVECVYIELNNADCHEWAVQFVNNTDPKVRDEVMFAISKTESGEWDFEYTQFVGKGDFVLKFSGIES